MVSTAGQVFLGITINCARCHDHKVDPIPQADYYRLLAFFNDVTDQNGKNLKAIPSGPGSSKRMEVMCVAERTRGPAHVLLRGDPAMLGTEVGPGVPEVLGGGSSASSRDLGKRRALADWLTDSRNPRTARVLANRLWQYHFGRGIVPTPNDFGKLGEPATHPELLDWLASELVSGGWRLKPMHRLIVLSSAYRMSSRATSAELAADPSDRWFWRFPMRRLAAEEVRDAILAVSGDLRLKAGGPSICPPIPREVLAGQSVPGKGWDLSPADEAARRSVYIHVKRSLLVPILATHDAADTDSSCPVRYTTTVPTQALGLLNGDFANEQAELLADRLSREAPGDPSAQVRRAVRLTTGREPDADEVRRDVAFLRTLRDRAGLDDRAALTQYAARAQRQRVLLPRLISPPNSILQSSLFESSASVSLEPTESSPWTCMHLAPDRPPSAVGPAGNSSGRSAAASEGSRSRACSAGTGSWPGRPSRRTDRPHSSTRWLPRPRPGRPRRRA